MTDEQRDRLAELLEKQKISERKKELRRLEERLIEEIPGFSEKYFFADDEQAKRLAEFAEEIHLKLIGNGLPGSPNKKILENRLVWMEFFLCNRDIFRVFVGGKASDFIADMDDWQDFDPFDVLHFDDLSGFIFIDRQQNITEITI